MKFLSFARGPKPISDEAIDFAWMLDANLTVDHLREMLFAGTNHRVFLGDSDFLNA